MLSLRQGFGLETISVSGSSWQPSDERFLEAWYKQGVGITTVYSNPFDYTTSWTDSSSNTNNMVNSDAISPPTAPTQPLYYGAPTHQMEFQMGWLTYLKSASSISLPDEFTIVLRIEPSYGIVPDGKFLSSDSLDSYFEYTSTNQIKFKLASGDTPQDLDLNGSTTFGDDYLVITRDSSDLVTLWVNGVEQTASVTSTSALTLNSLGLNLASASFKGYIREVQMYSISNATLTSNANTYASNL